MISPLPESITYSYSSGNGTTAVNTTGLSLYTSFIVTVVMSDEKFKDWKCHAIVYAKPLLTPNVGFRVSRCLGPSNRR